MNAHQIKELAFAALEVCRGKKEDENESVVLADWAEEAGLQGFANRLRHENLNFRWSSLGDFMRLLNDDWICEPESDAQKLERRERERQGRIQELRVGAFRQNLHTTLRGLSESISRK